MDNWPADYKEYFIDFLKSLERLKLRCHGRV